MNAVAYIRVSSKSQSLDLQRNTIAAEAERRGDTIVRWYEEKASAKTMKRTALEALRADVRTSAARKVYGFRLDRFVRSGPADAYALVQEFHQAGAELVTVADGLTVKGGDDLTTTVLLFAFSLAAQLERAAIADRIARKRALVEAGGGRWGRPRRFTAAEEAHIKELHARGLSHRAIAQKVHAPKATVTLVLKRAA